MFAISADGSAKTMADATELTAVRDAGQGALGNIPSFGEGASGELCIVDYGGKVVVVVPEPASGLSMPLGGGALGVLARSRRG